MSIKRKIIQNLINVPGWSTSRKIVVFESDDWGSMRMPSKKVYNDFIARGYKVNNCPYNSNDALESNEDVLGLLEVLSQFKDKNNQPAKFTINGLVANPNFEKIRASNFEKYFYHDIRETFKNENNDKVIDLFKEGIEKRIFSVQFHGREHLNVNRWMRDLQDENGIARAIFNYGMFTIHKNGIPNGRKEYLDAFGLGYTYEYESIKSIVNDGLKLFKEIWECNPKSFIAPNYFWNDELEREMSLNAVKYIQGLYIQKVPVKGNSLDFDKKYRYLGKKNNHGQIHLLRNAFFEPMINSHKDSVLSCVKDISTAFKWRKPAIICSHRANYIGSINSENRSNNLKQLGLLISTIIKKFPNVEFLSSDQLGDLITKN